MGRGAGGGRVTVAAVTLWGSRIAAVSIDAGARYATFQYDPAFVRSGIQVAPIRMPLRVQPYTFPGLPQDAFSGLPGLLADSLPDRWGTALVNAWLASEGRDESGFDVVERLCYVGTRGVGALEFEPARIDFRVVEHVIDKFLHVIGRTRYAG